EINACSKIARKSNSWALRAEISSEQLDAHLVQHSEVEVAATVMSGHLGIAQQPGQRGRKLVWRAVHEARFDHPPGDVAAMKAARHPHAATASEEHLATREVQLLRQLTSGLAAPDDQHRSWRQGFGVVIP